MIYFLYNESDELVGEFRSVYELEIFVDGVREGRGEGYPVTPRMSPFDYIKQIGWFLSITDVPVGQSVHQTPLSAPRGAIL
jgi:hypothetical protein